MMLKPKIILLVCVLVSLGLMLPTWYYLGQSDSLLLSKLHGGSAHPPPTKSPADPHADPSTNPEYEVVTNPPSPLATALAGGAATSAAAPTSPLPLPAEYAVASEDQQSYQRMFSTDYLRHIAAHQHAYCEPDSASYLQCFSAPRFPKPWWSDWSVEAGDPICIARGLSFTRNPHKPIAMHCQARDFAAERLKQQGDPSVPQEDLTGVPELEDFKKHAVYWFETGVGEQIKEWDFDTATPGCDKDTNNVDGPDALGQWWMLVRRENNGNIWHKLMELWQAVLTVDALQVAVEPSTGRPWLSAEDAKSMRVLFEDDRDDVVDELWPVINGRKPERRSDVKPGACLSNVVLPLAGSSSPFWTVMMERAIHEPCATARDLADVFIRRILQLLDLDIDSSRQWGAGVRVEPSITVINRTSTRKIWDMDRLVSLLRENYPKSEVKVVDFAVVPLREQIQLARDTDVLVGTHGAGLTHILFMRAGAAVVEFTVTSGKKFRPISNMRGVTHFEARCLDEEQYRFEVDGTPLPDGWAPGRKKPGSWQTDEWAYVTDGEWLRFIDSAVKTQRNRQYYDVR